MEYTLERKMVKPFLKWAGGKGQLLKEIEQLYPFGNKNITKYAEPFVGGGAVLFDVLNKFDLEDIYISDINVELINTYRIIRDGIADLLDVLDLYQREYGILDKEERKIYYMAKREQFNVLKGREGFKTNIERAALLIFLNKTCFNGLYRVNSKGLFNVPMGDYKNPLICDAENLLAISKKLQRVQIYCGDYRESIRFIDERTFVYIDPPYRPLTRTASFRAYTEAGFDDSEQIKLANFANLIHEKGAKFVVSNSDPKNVDIEDYFFDEIYGAYTIKRVDATRMINSNSKGRGKIKELLIFNF